MTNDIVLLVLAGGFCGGFVSGLTGFGTGLTALVFWLHALPPIVAAPLVVVCSIISQIQTLPKLWHMINVQRIGPFILGGLLGVPLGTLLLTWVAVDSFKLGVGLLLIGYCSMMLLGGIRITFHFGGRWADALIGAGGGVLGGLAGLSGPLPAIWVNLRGWHKDHQRVVLQTFNLTILSVAFISQTVAGLITLELAKVAAVALFGTITGTWLGRRLYDRLSNHQFRKIVLGILLFSGVLLILSSLH